MKKDFLTLLAATIISAILFSCSSSPSYDPEGAEVLLEPSIYANDSDYYTPVHAFTDRDGYKSVGFESYGMCTPWYYTLYSPSGNLLMALSCASEDGELHGYKMVYGPDGKVEDVIAMDDSIYEDQKSLDPPSYEKGYTQVLRRWLSDPYFEVTHFRIKRDSEGNPEKIGGVYVPHGYTAKYFISEWGPFWGDDIRGGRLAFMVLLEEQDKEGRSTVDYLYVDDHLVAEKAYWNGVFIKALYYDGQGHFDGIYEDRDADVFNEAFWHYIGERTEDTPWYLDQQ
jgi:hypothetical protein